MYLYQQAMAEHQTRHPEHEPEHEQGKGWPAEAVSEGQEGAAGADVGAGGHHFQQPLFSPHSFLMERAPEAEGREEQGGGAHGLHQEQYRADREAGPGPASGISTLAMALGLADPSSSKREVPPTPSPTTTIGAPSASPFHEEAEVDAAMDSTLPALSAAAKGGDEQGEQEGHGEQQEGGKAENRVRSPVFPTEDEVEEGEEDEEEDEEEEEGEESGREYGLYGVAAGVGHEDEEDEEDEETQNPGSGGMVREISEDRGDHYRVKRPKL